MEEDDYMNITAFEFRHYLEVTKLNKLIEKENDSYKKLRKKMWDSIKNSGNLRITVTNFNFPCLNYDYYIKLLLKDGFSVNKNNQMFRISIYGDENYDGWRCYKMDNKGNVTSEVISDP